MAKFKHIISTVFVGIFCLCASVTVQAATDVCSTASTINPNILDSGMGGTGIVAESGLGGTGVTNDNGFGGTGMTADGGMGGTGVSTEHGGFGGTGDAVATSLLPKDTQGGVAIIGVVTGFASICVNGEEVFYDKSTPVYDNGLAARLSSIATGKMVMLKADRVDGQLRARSIGLFDAVAGPVERIDTKLNQMQVMGQTVRLSQNIKQETKGLSLNTSVRVSGHRLDNGEIVATRVDIVKTDATAASTIGLVTSVDHDGMVVNGTRVQLDNTNITNKNVFDKIKVGNEVRVSGAWDGRAMKVDRVESQPITNSINRADTAIVEGFVRLGHENIMHLDGTDIQASQGNTSYSGIEKSHGKVVKIEMRRDNKGHWVYDKLKERSGKLFEQRNAFKGDGDSISGGELSSGIKDNSNMHSDSENAGSGSNSGSGSDSSDNSGGKHDSSSSTSSGAGSNVSDFSGHNSSPSSDGGRGASRDSHGSVGDTGGRGASSDLHGSVGDTGGRGASSDLHGSVGDTGGRGASSDLHGSVGESGDSGHGVKDH